MTNPKRLELTGATFGEWKVISFCAINHHRNTTWNVRCSCGTERVLPGRALTSGKSKSCGCLHFLDGKNAAYSLLWSHYTHGARKRGYAWELSKSQFIDLIGKDCHYCGAGPEPSDIVVKQAVASARHAKGRVRERVFNRERPAINGVDRVDNTIGYTVENSRTCCAMCNQMKMSYTEDAFIKKCEEIVSKQKERRYANLQVSM